MARYAPDHKDATRRRMIETSGRRFKRDGFDGAGIATLVADAGLTNGAFYGHFASKDDLIATVVSDQLAAQVAQVQALPLGLASVQAFVCEYLSPEHRDDPGSGCPSAALLDEIGRQDLAAQQAYTDGARTLVESIARHLAADGVRDPNRRAIGLLAALVGALQAARAVTDPDLSDHILSAARACAMTIATAHLHTATPTDQDPR